MPAALRRWPPRAEQPSRRPHTALPPFPPFRQGRGRGARPQLRLREELREPPGSPSAFTAVLPARLQQRFPGTCSPSRAAPSGDGRHPKPPQPSRTGSSRSRSRPKRRVRASRLALPGFNREKGSTSSKSHSAKLHL